MPGVNIETPQQGWEGTLTMSRAVSHCARPSLTVVCGDIFRLLIYNCVRLGSVQLTVFSGSRASLVVSIYSADIIMAQRL